MQIKALNPWVYVYCQNPSTSKEQLLDALAPILRRGEIIKLDNRGREGLLFPHGIS